MFHTSHTTQFYAACVLFNDKITYFENGGIVMRKRNCKTESRSERILDSISRSLDLPQDAVSGYAHIEISGNREAIIEGCQGVLEYGDSVIALNTGRLTVRVCGCELTIVSMQNGQAVIKGIITGVEYC